MFTVTCFFCAAITDLAVCPHCGTALVLQDIYRIVGVLGRGGFGTVYEAVDMHLGRRCAIKIVHCATRSDQELALSEARTLREASEVVAGVPAVYAVWTDAAQTVLVQEFVAGQALHEARPQCWTAAEVRAVLEQVLAILAPLHQRAIIHRDIKPANIVERSDRTIALLDFGIAKRANGSATQTAAKAFSPDFASPEQSQGLPTDPRSDLYSLGATAYQLLSGKAPPTALARLAQPGLALAIPEDDPELARLLREMLALDPACRPASAEAVLGRLAQATSAGHATVRIALPQANQQSCPAPVIPTSAVTPHPRTIDPDNIWAITTVGALLLIVCGLVLAGIHGMMLVSAAAVSADGATAAVELSTLLPVFRFLLVAISVIASVSMIWSIYHSLSNDPDGPDWLSLVLRIAGVGLVVMIGGSSSRIAEILVELIESSSGSLSDTTSVAWSMLALSQGLLQWGMMLVAVLMGLHWIGRMFRMMLDD